MTKSQLNTCEAYTTKDGSEIRELLHPNKHNIVNQSLAHARVEPHCTTEAHRHFLSEEIYYILEGKGVMTLGTDQFAVQPGDSILIAPNTVHCIHNPTDHPLIFLCGCSPAYSHDDTELI